MKKLRLLACIILPLFLLSISNISCTDEEDDNLLSINDIINSDPNFSILRAAVNRAGLSFTLSSGNYTVFAPGNTAFQASGINETEINNLPLAVLDDILNYHIANGRIPSGNIPISDVIPSIQGKNIYASRNANGVFVNGIPVISADIAATNGYIHVISSIMIAPTETISQIIQNTPDYSVMNAAINRANLGATFGSAGKYTLFVPDNDAFGAINETAINSYPSATVASIVRSHSLPTNVFLSDFMQGATTNSLQTGVSLLFTSSPESVKINGSAADPAYIVTPDIIATNGVIHVIDRVME